MRVTAIREIGTIRRVDGEGRIPIPVEHRRELGIAPGDEMSTSLVVDEETGRMMGLIVRPIQWAMDPTTAPRVAKKAERE